MNRSKIALSTLFTMLASSAAIAQVPSQLPVQGVLTDDLGAPLNGSFNVSVSLYASGVGGTALFTESQQVLFDTGAFTLYVGDQATLDWSILDGSPEIWVGIRIEADQEMTPRLRLAAVPWAARCEDAMSVNGLTAADISLSGHTHGWSTINNIPADIADGDDDSLSSLSCQPGQNLEFSGGGWSCGTDNIGLLTVGSGDLMNGAVTNAKIAAGAVTAAKVAAASIGPTQLGGAAVTAPKIASNAVRTVHIANDAVTASKIANNAVGSSEIANGSVTNAKVSLTSTEYCVVTGPTRTVPNRQLCMLTRVPGGVECRITRSGTNHILLESPSGPNNCCMRCI